MIHEIKSKSVLQKSKLPESPYCLNPFVGCLHRCCYCYARFMRRFTGHSEPWGMFIDVKINAPSILEKQLSRAHINGPVLIGSVCDAYQSVERRYRLTRECAKLLVSHGVSFSILTKSSLVLRDLDVLMAGKELITVGMSIAMLDDSVRKIVEPGASPIMERLGALEKLHSSGIKTYVFIGPVLPYITNPAAIVSATSLLVDEVWGEALNLRCGNSEDIARAYGALGLPRNWTELAKSKDYWTQVSNDVVKACQAAQLPLVGFYQH